MVYTHKLPELDLFPLFALHIAQPTGTSKSSLLILLFLVGWQTREVCSLMSQYMITCTLLRKKKIIYRGWNWPEINCGPWPWGYIAYSQHPEVRYLKTLSHCLIFFLKMYLVLVFSKTYILTLCYNSVEFFF